MDRARRHWSLPRFAVEHPHFTWILALVLAGTGFAAYLSTPQRMVPKVPHPNIGVVTRFPGMSAVDMQRYITAPLEKQIQIVGGIRYVLGTSQDGYSKIVVYFNYGVDLHKKWNRMQALVNVLSNQLPRAGPNTTKPRLVRVNRQNGPVVQYAVTRKGMNPTALKELLGNPIVQQFQLMPGVLSAYTFGGRTRQIQVIVNRNRLAAHHLSILDLNQAIDSADFNRGGGALSNDETRIEVEIPSEYRADNIARGLESLRIGSDRGKLVYLRDVAKVKDTHAQLYGNYYFNGKPAIWLGVQGENNFSQVKIAHEAQALVQKLEQDYPGLKFHEVFNRNFWIQFNNRSAEDAVLIAIALASLVMLLFLGEISGTLIAAAVLPSAIATGFLLLKALGFEISFAVTIGLIFVVGKLLDDSIVVVEVVRRRIDRGEDPRTAAIRGAEQVQKAILAASLVFVVLLFPSTQLVGPMGAGFDRMTVPLIGSVLASWLLAMTLTPLMASRLLRGKPTSTNQVGHEPSVEEELALVQTRPEDLVGRILYHIFLKHWHRFENRFMQAVTWSIEHKWIVLAAMAVSIWISLSLFDRLGVQQMPPTDTSFVLGYARATPGTSATRMAQIVKQIERIALHTKNVKNISALTGQSPVWSDYFTGYGVNTVNEARLLINLTIAKRQRRETIWEIEQKIYRRAKAEIPDLQVLFLKPVNPTPVSAARAPVQAMVLGPNLDEVYTKAQKVLHIAKTQAHGIHESYLDTVRGVPQLNVQVDKARARQLGLTVADVVGQVYYAINGGKTRRFFSPYRSWLHSRILIQYQRHQRSTPGNLQDLMIAAPDGQQVPLKNLAAIRRTTSYQRIYTYNGEYAASVLAWYKGIGLKAATQSLVMPAKIQLNLPKGYAVNPMGLMGTMVHAFNQLLFGDKIGLLAVFILLIVVFRSVGKAAVLMLAVPLEGLGAMVVLWLAHMDWDPPVLWALTILAGIVLGNSILMVDLIERFRNMGVDRDRAIAVASTQRLRPVVMTAMAAGVAMLPLGLFPPPGTTPFQAGALAISGGLFTSTLMTLLVIPAAYALEEDLMSFLTRFYNDSRWRPTKWPAMLRRDGRTSGDNG